MKTIKMIKTGVLPFTVMMFCMIFIVKPGLHGQDIKGKKGQPDVKIDVRREYDENGNFNRYDSSYSFSWSYDGSADMDSLFESLRDHFGISTFPDDDYFNRPFGYINPDDSIYHFNDPYDFFYHPYHVSPFNDTIFDEFFHDPMFGRDPFNWPEFDMRGMLENHRKMMEEMHKYFEYHMPGHPLPSDSIPINPLQQRHLAPSRPVPKGQEI